MIKEGHCNTRDSMSKGAGVIMVKAEGKALTQQHELEDRAGWIG